MDDSKRISPQDAWHETQGGNGSYALLVYASESEEDWRRHRLKSSIPGPALEAALADLSRDRKIIFYASGRDDAAAAQAARLWLVRGFHNVCVLWGGYDAWKAAGFPAETS